MQTGAELAAARAAQAAAAPAPAASDAEVAAAAGRAFAADPRSSSGSEADRTAAAAAAAAYAVRAAGANAKEAEAVARAVGEGQMSPYLLRGALAEVQRAYADSSAKAAVQFAVDMLEGSGPEWALLQRLERREALPLAARGTAPGGCECGSPTSTGGVGSYFGSAYALPAATFWVKQ